MNISLLCRINYADVIIIIDKEKAIEKINRINKNFEILSDFNGWREDIIRKCKICGDVRTVKARCLIEKDKNGNLRECIKCKAKEIGKSLRKSNEQFLKELSEINPNIKVLEEYTTNDNKIKCKCLICGNEWCVKPHQLLQGHGCPECSHKKQNWRNHEQFILELKERHPTITALDEYVTSGKCVRFKCDVCGYVWKTVPNVLLTKDSYSGCPKCNGYAKITEEEMIDRLRISNKNIRYIEGYDGIIKHAKFECLKCGNIWNTPPNSVLHGSGCPKCNLSHGNLKISDTLDALGIDYVSEHRFSDCKDIRSLPFDFYIPSMNICIEYDGEQHFKPIRFSKASTIDDINKKFEDRKRKDKIKDDYCKNNNIELIRIPYTEFNNIEKILNEKIA